MKQFKFKKIDAFARKESDGNPAGYIWLDSKNAITTVDMQKIAKELKGYVNEVGFIYQTANNEFNLKYFSSEREVDFCGHATIAIMYDLIKNNEKLQKNEKLSIKTNRGELDVENRIKTEDSVFIMSPEPTEKEIIPEISIIAKNLHINESEIRKDLPITIIDAGLSTLLVPIVSLHSILAINPDINKLNNFCSDSNIDIIEVFSTQVSHNESDFRTRVFAPTFGYLEDPATGSGNSAFGYYLIKNNMWHNDTILIEQNGLQDKFNQVRLQRRRDENGMTRVLFGGGAITRIEGTYNLY